MYSTLRLNLRILRHSKTSHHLATKHDMNDQVTAAPSAEVSTPGAFRLLDLPAELRDYIYELALTTEDTLYICGGTSHELQQALTQTTRQVRHETLPIFYGRNTFVICRYGSEAARKRWVMAIESHLWLLGDLGFDCILHTGSTRLKQDARGLLRWYGIKESRACTLQLGRRRHVIEDAVAATNAANEKQEGLTRKVLEQVFALLCVKDARSRC